MSHTTLEKPKQDAKTEAIKELQNGRIAIARIQVKTNIRKHFDEGKLKELSENIKKVGDVLEPILVRYAPGGNNGYVLIAGERRLRAAKMAGLTEIPSRVLDANDQQAAEIQAFENLHRVDLSPLEEARAFKMLRDAGKYSIADLASRVSKSAVTIERSIALLELEDDVQEAIEDGRLTPAHGLQILRVPKDKRSKIAKLALTPKTDWMTDANGEDGQKKVKLGYMTAKELQVQVDSELGTPLAKAQFCIDKPYAGEVACTACPLNAANQGMLFEGAGEQRCLNRPCYDRKTEQFHKDLQAEGAKKWPQLTFIGRGKQDNHKKRSIDGLPGNAMLSTEEQNNPVIKKLLATKPHKLGYAVVLPKARGYDWNVKAWDKARLVLVVMDPPLIGGVTTEKIVDCTKPEKKSKKKTSSRSTSAEKAPDPKGEFIAEAVKDALMQAVAVKALTLKPSVEDWREMAERLSDDVPAEIVCQLLGKEGHGYAIAELRKLSLESAIALTILSLRIDSYSPDESDWKAIGVDVAGVKAKARAEAEKKWADQVEAEKQAVLKKHNAPAAK